MTPKKRITRSSPATTSIAINPMTDAQLKTLITQVVDVLAECDATRIKNGEDNHDSGTSVRRQAPLARECTYLDFLKCRPLYFKGLEGVFELTQWTVGHDVAYAMTWTNLKKMMTDKYYPRGEIKKLEVEMWSLKVKGIDVVISSGGSFVSAVTGQMTYPVASLTLDNARSYVMQGASFTQGLIFSIPIGGSISPEGFVPSIMLLVVIIVTVVIVVVILVVVVVGGDVSYILKRLFMIIGFLRRIMFYYLLHQSLGYGNSFFQGLRF
nr:hypothetical protein [Tanacetum cinerariifolium]